ncbi:MAG: hypothetical protein ACLVJO_13980 [[Clostridium] scindens]
MQEALRFITEAITKADISRNIVIGGRSSHGVYDKSFKKCVFEGEGRMHGHKVIRSVEELIDYYEELAEEFPIASIEDPG